MTVSRDHHGEPDQVILNLAELEKLAKATGTHDSPQQVAAQFLFLDTLWYMRYYYDADEFGDVLWALLPNPDLVPNSLAEVLSIHATAYCEALDGYWHYNLSIPSEGQWLISYGRVCQGEDSANRSWEFDGELNQAPKEFL